MEDARHYPSVLGGESGIDSDWYQNFSRLSKFGVGSDPVESGELDRLADANRSLNESLGYTMGQDSGMKPVSARFAEQSYESIQLSEMMSPGMSVAQSFSRIEGRLSLTPRGDGGDWQQDGADFSGDFSQYDNGGFLNDSFE